MSDSSQDEESQIFYKNSDYGDSSAFSIASHLQGRSKRSRDKQTLGRAWVVHSEIKTHLLPIDSDDAKFQKMQSQLQIAFSAKFENCLGKCAATSRISRFSATLQTLCIRSPQQQQLQSKYEVSFN
jgi:hypothetical protein